MTVFKRGWALLCALLLLLFALLPTVPMPAAAASPSYDIHSMDIAMDVAKDRTAEVKETISVSFSGYGHGIIRDFDLTEGVRYAHISATRDGMAVATEIKFDRSDMLSLYIGDESDLLTAEQVYTYVITYKMAFPTREEGRLPLDVVGYDWSTRIEKVHVRLTLPGIPVNYTIYSGYAGTMGNLYGIDVEQSGNVFDLTGEDLNGGITLDLKFSAGVLGHAFDFSLLYVFLAAFVLGGVFLLFKLLFARQPLLTRTINFTAPDEMDPLIMGTRLDGTMDTEDLGALVFWFASKGYLTIDLSQEEDPLLIKTQKALPEDAPSHQKIFLDGLFALGDQVRLSSLERSFYHTAESVRTIAQAGPRRFEKRGSALMTVFGVLTVLLLGFGVWLYDVLTVGGFFLRFMPLLLSAGAYAMAVAIACNAQRHRYNRSRAKTVLLTCWAVSAGGLLAIISLLFYSPACSLWTDVLVAIFASIAGMGAAFFTIRTKEHTEWLNKILGFKEFIETTEKDRIAFMLKEQPALYYDILPYAQVLGVSSAWTDKFEGLTMSEPPYVRYRTGDAVFSAVLWNHTFHSLNRTMAHSFAPPRSGPTNRGGGFGGGGFGGHGGGGFGGGGGRAF